MNIYGLLSNSDITQEMKTHIPGPHHNPIHSGVAVEKVWIKKNKNFLLQKEGNVEESDGNWTQDLSHNILIILQSE